MTLNGLDVAKEKALLTAAPVTKLWVATIGKNELYIVLSAPAPLVAEEGRVRTYEAPLLAPVE